MKRLVPEFAAALPVGVLMGVAWAVLGVLVQHLSGWALVGQAVVFGAATVVGDVALEVWRARPRGSEETL